MPSVPSLPRHGLPRELAAQVVGVETFGAEEGVDHLAVGGGRRGGVGALAVAVVVGRALPGGLLPQDLARVAVERDDLEGVLAVGADAVGVLPLLAPRSCASAAFAPGTTGPSTAVVTKTRLPQTTGLEWPLPGSGRLPADVLRLAPLLGQALLGRDARAVGAAPLRPVRVARRAEVAETERASAVRRESEAGRREILADGFTV